MTTVIKTIIKVVFGGISGGLQLIIEHWKIAGLMAISAYFLFLSLKVRNLKSEVTKLENVVYVQDSIITASRSQFIMDSLNMSSIVIQTQQTLAEVNLKNKKLEREKAELAQLTKDLADGIKCKNIFGKIVNCKKKD